MHENKFATCRTMRTSCERRRSRGAVPGFVVLTLALLLAGCGGRSNDQSGQGNADTRTSDTGTRDANNTGINARDTSATAMTPTDQGGSEADRGITQSIRKLIIASDMSSDAKNAKVITANGAVTLRGPVANAEEKAAVERMARSVSGVVSVDNQLEIKSSNTEE